MKKVLVRGDEELFNRWKNLQYIPQGLASIVQNDMAISMEQFQEWQQEVFKFQIEIDNLKEETIDYLENHCVKVIA